jgi:hypothetical protein
MDASRPVDLNCGHSCNKLDSFGRESTQAPSSSVSRYRTAYWEQGDKNDCLLLGMGHLVKDGR